MLDIIKKVQKSDNRVFNFSILLPTWNNLPYLKLCIESIKNNSSLSIQIIVIVNEGADGTVEWIEQQGTIDYVHAKRNIGICYGVNIARSLVKADYIMYLNDDMYVLPEWDKFIYDEIQKIGHSKFMLSGTMIQPHSTRNPCVIIKDFGSDLASFKKQELLDTHKALYRNNWMGSTWPPNVIHRDMWDLIGGFSVEFSPGMYSDPDFSKKVYDSGVRIFKGIGNSLVYHFVSKSTKRIIKNNGRNTFLLKWGLTARTFSRKFLNIGSIFTYELQNYTLSRKEKFVNTLKRVFSCLK